MGEYNSLTYEGLIEEDEGDNYPQAGQGAQPEIHQAIARYRSAPKSWREVNILLWWLLGSGSPPYKQSKPDANYLDKSPVRGQYCSNCIFAYKRLVTGQLICSRMRLFTVSTTWEA